MNYITRTSLLMVIIATTTLSSCSDFLDRDPIDKLTPNSFFKTEKDLQLYAYSFYNQNTPSALTITTDDGMADYTSKQRSTEFMLDSYNSVSEAAWSWSKLRNINYFLQQCNNPEISIEARNHYIGIARFFRAYFYLDKVQTYGDVPWYNKPLGTSDPDLYKKRDSRELVMDSVLADINFACSNIRETKDATASQITRLTALAMKSRICLFEGTFRKYHTELGLTQSANSWLTAAASAAKELIDLKKYSLYNTGKPESDYRTLFTSEDPVSQEVIWASVYNDDLKRYHEVTWRFNSSTYGSRWGLIRQFVDTYLMADGSRFTDKVDYDKVTFMEEMKDRDKRLPQTIRSLGYTRSDGTPAPPDFGVTYTGYHILKHSLDDKTLDGVGKSYNSVPIIRYAEVLLNYAEAMAELNKFDENIWQQTIALLRKRAGVNADVPLTADTYLETMYFPEISDKFLLEIRRERGIELCYEGLRYNDLLRWKKGKLMEMQWKGIYVPAMNIEMDLDGNGKPDVCFVIKAPSKKTSGVIYYIIDNVAANLTEKIKGNVTWRDEEKRTFSDKMYYHPISNEDRKINPQLTQNPGWE